MIAVMTSTDALVNSQNSISCTIVESKTGRSRKQLSPTTSIATTLSTTVTKSSRLSATAPIFVLSSFINLERGESSGSKSIPPNKRSVATTHRQRAQRRKKEMVLHNQQLQALVDNMAASLSTPTTTIDNINNSELSSRTLECIICYERIRSVLIMPCRHVCVCGPCSQQLKLCPLCNGILDELIPVFV